MLEQIWQFLTEKLSGLIPYISPFWYEWLPYGLTVIVVACFAGWFFPPLRSLAGAVVMSVIAALYAFKKGEDTAAERYRKEIARLKQQRRQQQPTNANWWSW